MGARRRLGIPDNVPSLLFFGQMRRYKNVDGLLEAFRSWDCPEAVLTVAGRANNHAYRAELVNAAARDPRVRMQSDYISNDAVSELFAAADLVVLPFRRILNSGSVMLALSFARPVLVPRTAVFEELSRVVGPFWVRCFDPPLSSGDIDNAVAAAGHHRSHTTPDLTLFEWHTISQATLRAYGLPEIPT
jgi:glycosyltransferase involved in cell wall biosynthesis